MVHEEAYEGGGDGCSHCDPGDLIVNDVVELKVVPFEYKVQTPLGFSKV